MLSLLRTQGERGAKGQNGAIGPTGRPGPPGRRGPPGVLGQRGQKVGGVAARSCEEGRERLRPRSAMCECTSCLVLRRERQVPMVDKVPEEATAMR